MKCPNRGNEIEMVNHRMESTFCFESLDFKWVDLHDNPKLVNRKEV